MITIGRQEIEAEALTKMQALSTKYAMGISTDQVQLKNVNPPEPVQGSFNEVNQAQQEKETNAGKYGALSVDAGRVDVRWRLEGDIFMMSWTERNGPPMSPPERRGFGSTVVDSMMKRSVSGEVKLNCAPSGLIWRLTCPAANALEAKVKNLKATRVST